jgi:hypothetical protein
MSLRACAGHCGTLIPAGTRSGRCPTCERQRDAERGTRQQRGYDADFERAKRDPDYLAATHCVECGEPFTEANPKTGGHSIALREGGKGSKILPHCRRCNYGWRRTGL